MLKYVLAATTALTLLGAASASAAVITPVSVVASNTFERSYSAEDLINGSGLSNGLHDGDWQNMWMTELGNQSATLTFDLGAVYDLDAANIWNYNTDFGMGYSLVRGARDIVLSLSLDGLFFTQAATDTLSKGTGLPLPAQVVDLDGRARFVRLDILNNYGDQYSPVGLSEVNFTATPVSEPATLGLLGLGLAALARRRRAAR